MADTDVRECHEGMHWRAFAHVDKYSPDQDAWAQKRFAEEQSWHGIGLRESAVATMIRRIRHRPVPKLEGADYRRYFVTPEDGYAEAAGNLMTTEGLTTLFTLFVGTTPAGRNFPFGSTAGFGTPGQAVVGVGSVATAATVADVHLGGDGSSTTAYYQGLDATFPTFTTGPPTLVTAQVTYASANGNFVWNEWGWCTGAGAITPSGGPLQTTAAVYATAGSSSLINHKIASLGTKASGAAWVFTTTVTIT